jgi:hypothetical protein
METPPNACWKRQTECLVFAIRPGSRAIGPIYEFILSRPKESEWNHHPDEFMTGWDGERKGDGAGARLYCYCTIFRRVLTNELNDET